MVKKKKTRTFGAMFMLLKIYNTKRSVEFKYFNQNSSFFILKENSFSSLKFCIFAVVVVVNGNS